jgi:hypothetical protein
MSAISIPADAGLADRQSAEGRTLSKRDFAIGTIIAIAMATAFATLSHGRSLWVTFLPGLGFAWLVFAWIFARSIELPRAEKFAPLFFAVLAIQFLHFAEEFMTGFRTFFPALYAGAPYEENLFVWFNMISYAAFTLACVLTFYRNLRFLLVPVLFFIVYGATGNAISHTWWAIDAGGYRPGLITAQAYWIAGPVLLHALLGSRLQTGTFLTGFAVVLVSLIQLFAVG